MRKTARYRKLISSFAILALLAGCGEKGDLDATVSPGAQTSPDASVTSGEDKTDKDVSPGEKDPGQDEATPSIPAAQGLTYSGKDLSQVAPLPQKEELVANDFLLYFVNCASAAASSLDGFGLFQSVADQPFGTDKGSGRDWGYLSAEYMQAQGDVESADRKAAKWGIAEDAVYGEDTGYRYYFELPAGNYEVTCGFYDPFSPRNIDISAEGKEVISGQKILKFKETEFSFETEVTDGELDLFVYNAKRGQDAMQNPELSYIIVRAVPEYDGEMLAMMLEASGVSEEELKEYRTVTVAKYKESVAAAKKVADSDSASEGEIREAYENLKKAFEGLEKKMVYNAFTPGKTWQDTDGNKIQAHGGQVQKLTVLDKQTGEPVEKWWWVGEDKTKGYRGGICAYSSFDLYNWEFEGVVMRNVTSREELDTDEYFKELYAGYTKEQLDNVYRCINDSTSVIERPKMIHNEKTGQYLLWFHADGPTETSDANYAAASAGLAVSETPYGPFRFVDRYRLNTCPEDQEDMYPQSKGMARDMNLFVDDDGTAYIIYSSEENLTIYISKLNDTYDYLCTDPEKAVYGKDFIRLYPGAQREAPAIIKREGKYYLMTSGATGWAPNQARYWVADEIFGEWVDMGDPCIGDDKRTTFDSQSTCIFLADDGTVIYMGDRWNSDNLGDSRYIWLPVLFDDEGKMSISWQDSWTLKNP